MRKMIEAKKKHPNQDSQQRDLCIRIMRFEPSFTNSNVKVCFIMIDGLGEISDRSLHYQTTLQAAKTPNMDKLSTHGVNGLMDPVEPGLACGSDTAHMSIFGYEPREHYRGRGSFETMGTGLDMKHGDIAFKCNFATCVDHSPQSIVKFRRADRNFEELGPVLCEFLEQNLNPFEFVFNGEKRKVEVAIKYATEHRCGIRIRGENLSGDITGTDPLRDNLPLKISKPRANAENDFDAQLTSTMLNQLSDRIRQLLTQNPINIQRAKEGKNAANVVLFRGCGVRIQVPTFREVHGFIPFMVAPTAIIAGLGKSLDMDLVKIPGDTGDYHTDIMAQAKGFVETIMHKKSDETNESYNFGFCHIKVIDDAGHDGNIPLKIEFLEKVDAGIGYMWETFTNKYRQRVVFVLTGDHSTPCYYKDHSFEPVPFVICGNYPEAHKIADQVQRFEEISNNGFLGRFPGIETMNIIKNYIQVTTGCTEQ
jgi:2,3-diphosphopglycerate-independent phosphoglycerate mutase